MLRSETVQKVVVAEQVLLLLVSPGCCERTVDFAHRMVLCSLEAEQGFDFQAAFFLFACAKQVLYSPDHLKTNVYCDADWMAFCKSATVEILEGGNTSFLMP